MFKRKSTRRQDKLPTEVRISKVKPHREETRAKNMESQLQEEIPLAQSDFNQSKIAEIQGRFQGGCVSFSRGPPFVEKNGSLCISAQTLLVPGRIFIREGTLLKVCRRGPKPRHFFLFNDVLVRKERVGVARLVLFEKWLYVGLWDGIVTWSLRSATRAHFGSDVRFI